MSGRSPKYRQMTFEDLLNVISSPELAAGRTPSGSPAGPTTGPCGPAPAPANLSAPRPGDAAVGPRVISTSGLHGGPLSLNAHLALSLANRLPTPEIGLMASAMTWNHWATKSGRQFFRLAVSVSIMSDIGCTLSATPTATANQSAPSMQKHPGCRLLEVSPKTWRERMGYPAAWGSCGATAMQSCRKSLWNSSGRS